jgi:hypothetical protein
VLRFLHFNPHCLIPPPFFLIFSYSFFVCLFVSVSLTKEIDFWRQKSDSLSEILAQNDKEYSSKLDIVLAEQESLSEQQQQVLRELSAALAAQHAMAEAAAAASASAGGRDPGTSSPTASGAAPAVLFSPDLVRPPKKLFYQLFPSCLSVFELCFVCTGLYS